MQVFGQVRARPAEDQQFANLTAADVCGRDHEDQAMQYDWSGVRTRRIQRLKATMYLACGTIAVVGPVFLLPGIDLDPLLTLVR